MTTLLSPKPKMERGSWRRTFVSRMKFFFKVARAPGWGSEAILIGGEAARHGRAPAGRRPAARSSGAANRARGAERRGAVSPMALRVVQPGVSALDAVRLRLRVARERGDAERERHPQLALPGLDRRLGHLLADALGGPHGASLVGLGHDERELLAAVARDDVGRARLALEDARDLLQDAVPHGVSVGVVHGLEVIDVG